MSDTENLKIHEAHERAELTHENESLAPVSLTMAILAVFVAAISLLSHRAHTEVLLLQTQANFQKAELVGKATQQHADEILIGLLDALATKNNPQAAALKERFNRERQQYETDLGKVQAEEQRLEQESRRARRKANRLDIGELLCEMALVLSSITLLNRRRIYWLTGVVAGALGIIAAVSAFWIG